MKQWWTILVACWLVTGHPLKTIDGDTFDARIEIWPGLIAHERIRVLGVDTPEMKGPTRAAGEAAKRVTSEWLAKGAVDLTVCQRDAFGRLLATVTRNGENLAVSLIAAGHGVPR